jgi:hypothetical protein
MKKQSRQAKSPQRTARRPVSALDDGSPEAAWMRVPASKGGPGGGAVGMMKRGLVLMFTDRLAAADRLFREAQKKAPGDRELRPYRAATRMLGVISPGTYGRM